MLDEEAQVDDGEELDELEGIEEDLDVWLDGEVDLIVLLKGDLDEGHIVG